MQKLRSEKQKTESQALLKSSAELPSVSMKNMFMYFSGTDKILFTLAIAFTVGYSITSMLISLSLGSLINSLTDSDNSDHDIYVTCREVAIILLSISAFSFTCCWIATVLFVYIGATQACNWKKHYFSAVLTKPIKYFDKHNPAELGSSIDSDCDSISQALGDKLMLILSGLAMFLASWTLAFVTNAFIAAVCITVVPFQLAAGATIKEAALKEFEVNSVHYKTAGGIAEESLEGVKTVASLNAENQRAMYYQKVLEPLKKLTTKVGFLQGFGWGSFFAVIYVYTGIIFYFGAWLEENTLNIWGWGVKTDSKELIILYMTTSMSSFYLGSVAPNIAYIEKGKLAVVKMLAFLNSCKKADGVEVIENPKGSIRFDNVFFNYPTKKEISVLNGISFEVKPGNSLALVGETGCGKSTIIQLVEGFYYANSGVVEVDGIDIKKLDLKELRKMIALVSQEPILFDCNIKENIRMGCLDASDEKITQAAIEAEAMSFIEKLPDQFNTYAGLKGSQLSGGQKQRIAIARAVIKNPKILLLDEATSALDIKTEKKIQGTLDKIMLGKTTIIVAQRLSTIRNSNTIAVIENGLITETGDYNSLALANGKFSRLLEVQQKVEIDSLKSKKSIDSIAQLKQETSSKTSGQSQKSTEKALFMTISSLKDYYGLITITILSAIIAGATLPIYGFIFGLDLNAIMGLHDADRTGDTKIHMYFLMLLGAIVLVMMTTLSISLARVAALYTHELRYKVIKALLYYEAAYFDKPETSPSFLSASLGTDCDKISKVGGPVLGMLAILISAIVVMLIICFMYDPILTICIIPFIPLMGYTFSLQTSIKKEGIIVANLKETTAIASESLTNVKTVYSFNRQEYFYDLYIQASDVEKKRRKAQASVNGVKFAGVLAMSLFLYATLSWVGGARINSDNLGSDEIMLIFYTVVYSTWTFMVVGIFANDIIAGIGGAKRLLGILEHKPEIDAQSLEGCKDRIKGKVEFHDVIFKYANRDVIVLNSVSFKVEPGSSIGITGTTGSGKSTIAQLLLRFYDVTSGEILLDSIPLKNYKIKHLRKAISWVGQEPLLFKGSILLNLQMAKADLSETEAYEALTKAQGADIIEKYGFLADVGLRGSQLSGGQKQRVAIARAIVRNSKILILDEATSALDYITESRLQAAIKNDKQTLISIAHRLKTIQDCDTILLLEKGVVAEIGTHESLINLPNGFYAKLYQSSK